MEALENPYVTMDSLQGILNADLDEAKNYVRRLKQDNKANFRKTSCEPYYLQDPYYFDNGTTIPKVRDPSKTIPFTYAIDKLIKVRFMTPEPNKKQKSVQTQLVDYAINCLVPRRLVVGTSGTDVIEYVSALQLTVVRYNPESERTDRDTLIRGYEEKSAALKMIFSRTRDLRALKESTRMLLMKNFLIAIPPDDYKDVFAWFNTTFDNSQLTVSGVSDLYNAYTICSKLSLVFSS